MASAKVKGLTRLNSRMAREMYFNIPIELANAFLVIGLYALA